MGKINETLTLTDNFSSPMRTVDNIIKQTSASAIQLDKNLTRAMGKSAGAVIGEIRQVRSTMQQTNDILSQMIQKQQRYNEKTKETQSQWSKVFNTIKNAAIVSGSISLVKKITSAADQQSTLNARINMMNDGLQTAMELQKMIYQSAQNSRGSYNNTAEMVGKFGTLAPDAFDSSAEIVKFAEQINKHLTLSGASGAGGDAAILQLTQALGSGTLRGEELNSVLEQTPTIAQAIAKYMGVNIAKMRELAADGQITADVVKNALFATAEETNAKFAEMPMTFAQLWQSGINAVQQAAMPFLQTLAKGATLIHDNWDDIAPVLMGIAAAAGAVAIALGFQAAASWIAKAANEGLVASLLTNPLTWIAVGIGVVVGLIYKWIQSVGGITVAWLIAKNYLLTAWSDIQIKFMTCVFGVQNFLDAMNLKFITVGNSIANAVGDMKVNVLTQIQGMVNGAIDLLNDFISAVNKIPGVGIELVDKVTFAASAAASNEAAKSARAEELASLQNEVKANEAKRAAQLAQMEAKAAAQETRRLAEIARTRYESQQAGEDPGGIDTSDIESYIPKDIEKVGSVGSVKNIDGDVKLSDEYMKLYRDLAERRYMNQIELQTLAPQINVTLGDGANAKNLSPKEIANAIAKVLAEQQAAHTSVSHA